MNNFLPADSGEQKTVTHFGFLSPKTFCSYFLEMMYVEFVKNFLLADSGVQMPVRLTSAP